MTQLIIYLLSDNFIYLSDISAQMKADVSSTVIQKQREILFIVPIDLKFSSMLYIHVI